MAIHPPFALFDSDDHSLTIDIGDLQTHSLGDAQSGSVADRQDRSMLEAAHTTQKLQNFFRTQHNRQLLGRLGRWNNFFQAPILTKYDFVEKAKSRYSDDNRAWSELFSFVR